MVRVEARSLLALSDADVGRWRALAARAAESNPYFEPDFALLAAQHLGERAGSLLIVDDGPGSAWSACLPVRREARFRKLPGPALMTWLHAHAYLGTPLMDPERLVPAWRAMLRHGSRDPFSGFFGLEQLGEGGPVSLALATALREEGLRGFLYERVERAALYRREDGDYLNPSLGSRRRRELHRQRRQLAEQLGGAVIVHERAGDPAAVDRFLALEAAGWKGDAGTALSAAGHGNWFRAVAREFAAAGRLQLLELTAGDRVIAMKCNLLAGDAIFCLKIAYDETLARFSPGVQLELDNITVFHATPGIAWTDSCASPDNEMINRLWRQRRAVVTVLVAGSRAFGAPSRLVVRGALQARRLLRKRHDPPA